MSPLQVTPHVHHGELFLRVDLSGCSVPQRSFHPPSRQTEAQARAQLRTGETAHLFQPKAVQTFWVFRYQTHEPTTSVFLCICEKCMNFIQLLRVCNHEAGIKLHLVQY